MRRNSNELTPAECHSAKVYSRSRNAHLLVMFSFGCFSVYVHGRFPSLAGLVIFKNIAVLLALTQDGPIESGYQKLATRRLTDAGQIWH